MSPEAQRIAIAEACGWKKGGLDCDGYQIWIHPSGAGQYEAYIPDYLNDLNAMHEALCYAQEHLMNADQWEELGKQLEKQHHSACLKATDGTVDFYDFATLIAELTAANIAEAFLRTLGLWKDDACPPRSKSDYRDHLSKI